MTRRFFLAAGCAALALATLPSLTARAQSSGTTVDTFQHAPGTNVNTAAKMAVDAAGNLYAVGNGTDAAGVAHWLVRKSADGGLTWYTVDDFHFAANSNVVARSVAVGPAGEVYVGGEFRANATDLAHWAVRKSVDGGLTWKTVDDYRYTSRSSTHSSWANAVTVDASGTVYVVGRGGIHWQVRKSTNGGATWQIVDSFAPAQTKQQRGPSAEAYAITIDGAGRLYVAGTENSAGYFRWFVRKSTDGGTSFFGLTGSSFQLAGNVGSPRAIACDATGNVFVAGDSTGTDASTSYHAIVRRSVDGGATWTTVDDYQYAAGKPSSANDLLVGSQGQIWVALACGDSTGTNGHWVIRSSIDGGTAFSNFDDYMAPGSRKNSARGLVESAGSLFTCGHVGFPLDATTNEQYWVVRRY